jgi:uncharacterized membrane protein
MPMIQAALLCLHVLAAALWVGGMATMHFAVRPAAAQALPPPQRLPFMAAALGRFFAWVGVAIVVLLLSGLAMILLSGGFAAAHWRVHWMFGLGLVMIGIFVLIRVGAYRRLQQSVAAGIWPAAAVHLNRIRHLVVANLLLGTATFVVALLGRAL